MLRLIDRHGKPTEHTGETLKELRDVAKTLWGDVPPADDDNPDSWRIEAEPAS